jgi:hypothetical protein
VTSAVPEIPSASKTREALGEQALARTMLELEEMGSKFRDLAEFLTNKRGPLGGNDRDLLAERCEPIMAFVAEVQRLCSCDVSSPILTTAPSPTPTPRPTQSLKRKDKSHLLPASPEKASKRHQSYAPH